jgi:hypothetical protein
MKSNMRVAWGLVALTILLLVLGHILPPGGNPSFFGKFAEKRLEFARPRGGPAMRSPAVLPLPQRYIERTRAEVERRMAKSDWPGLSQDEQRRRLLEVLLISGIDAEYWSLPEDRQRRVADAYVRAFLDPH